MNLLQRIFGARLAPAWEITPGEVIWKLQPTPGGILMGESRDVERKTMSLFAIDPAGGQLLFRDIALHDPWWIALEMTVGEVALLHSFPRPDLPDAMGTTAVDCATGQVLWRNDTFRAICGTEELALVQRGDKFDWSALALIDARTGTVLEELGGDPERAEAFQQACEAGGIWQGWINSEPLLEDHPRFKEISGIVGRLLKTPRGAMELAEYPPFTVIGAHARSARSAAAMLANLVDTHLIVLRDDRAVYQEIVTADAPGPSSDIFFIWNGVLIFIRDRRTLAGINLDTA